MNMYIFRSSKHPIQDCLITSDNIDDVTMLRSLATIISTSIYAIFDFLVLISLVPILKATFSIFSILGYIIGLLSRPLARGISGLRRHPVILHFQPDPQDRKEVVGGG